MVTLLTRVFIKDYDKTTSPAVRQSYGILCGSVGIFFNIVLFITKCLAGILSGSIAIMADALNNLSDAGSSIITLVGFKLAGQKPDKDHPFGHGRIEYISGLFVAVIILIMAFELLKSAVEKIIHPEPINTSPVIILILVISILVKLYMSLYNRNIGMRINSAAMRATAMDSISDTVATLVVLLTTLAAYFFNWQIDGYCGIIVGAFVAMAGISAMKETINPLLGQAPEKEFVESIEQIIWSHQKDGVLGIHDLVVHDYGPGRIMITAHVEVPATGDILTMHDAIDVIERELTEQLHCHAVLHMDPVSTDDEQTNELKEKVEKIIERMDPMIQFHDFRIVTGPTHTNIIFDVVIPFDYAKSAEQLVSELQAEITKLGAQYFAVIDVDRSYV